MNGDLPARIGMAERRSYRFCRSKDSSQLMISLGQLGYYPEIILVIGKIISGFWA
jgi:hypothetical protein